MFSIPSILEESRQITEEFEKLSGRWNWDQQIAHVHSEVSEVYQAIKHNDELKHIYEEMADVFLSFLTLANLLGMDSNDIERAVSEKLAVVKERVRKLKEASQ